MDLKDETGYRWIDEAIDKNQLIFDPANRGYVTKRLIYHMKAECRNINTVLIPLDVYVEDLPPEWRFDSPYNIYGIDIVWDERLISAPKNGIWLQYYFMRGGSLFDNRTDLVIGYNTLGNIQQDNVILGDV